MSPTSSTHGAQLSHSLKKHCWNALLSNTPTPIHRSQCLIPFHFPLQVRCHIADLVALNKSNQPVKAIKKELIDSRELCTMESIELLESNEKNTSLPSSKPITPSSLAPMSPTSSASATEPLVISAAEQQCQLALEVQKQYLEREKEYSANKGTEVAYPCHLKNYEDWYTADQMQRQNEGLKTGLMLTLDSAHPITATKVALFLEYEQKQPKIFITIMITIISDDLLNLSQRTAGGQDELPNTRVGTSSIKQAINALENYRLTH
ncbi:hypothetical protein CVT24_005488 [Panaeolus cyanescens]|uniref:Uncharacterized protein n=1 Tax=Panaeolus cyanescens TaxID=181874 RepID=A0A409WY29_9AGAR|nr:hypothetical protein CVT24_005488 [Panaeolus cyanescens]